MIYSNPDGTYPLFNSIGDTLSPCLVAHCVPDSEGGYEAAKRLLEICSDITAIFAFNDLTATGILRACRELNYHVPDDVEIISVDDIPLASLVTPALSTLRIAKRELGARAMDTLLRLMTSDKPVQGGEQIIKPELILRESTTTP